MQIDESILGN